MTDLVTAPGSESSRTEDFSGDRPVEWAPHEPAPKKKRLGLWIGLGAGAVVLAAAAASMILIAPGTSVAGVQVGGMTPGMAAETISTRLAQTEVTLTGAGDDAVVTGADLGASVDATALAEQAFAERPMWNVGQWNGETVPATITFDAEAAEGALRSAVPTSFADPTDATVVFDATAGTYTVTPDASGTGIDVATLGAAFIAAIGDGDASLDFSGDPTEAVAAVTTDEATQTAEELNGMLASIGFYVGEERTVPVAAATAASWLTVHSEDGALRIEADEAAIQATIDALPAAIDRAPVSAVAVVNDSGEVLREITEGATGRTVGDLSTAAGDFADQLAAGNAAFAVPVEEVPFATSSVVRQVEVNLSEQRLYLRENGKVIDSWLISSGKRGNDTETGKYPINWKLESQNMGREDTTVRPFYYQPNVRWVMYFNGDQALHGVYWHSAWGTRKSHGCVGMPNYRAQQIYEWAPRGAEVWVHN